MYSGTTLRTKSGRLMGAHQKIDRVAFRNVQELLPAGTIFPSLSSILHFEGKNGPDGIKSKSPAQDEPWHYIDPSDPEDRQLFGLVEEHSHNLTTALREKNLERAAFEAAWLAHAIVDGLTPAHHYPLSDKIEELWGKPKEERQSIRDKNIIRGSSRRDTVSKNWQYWGAKGVFTTHFMFEFGFASSVSPLRFADAVPTADELAQVKNHGITPLFEAAIHQVYALGMYEEYYKKGWNRHLAYEAREVLAPIIINTVTLAWYAAGHKAAA